MEFPLVYDAQSENLITNEMINDQVLYGNDNLFFLFSG